jgi:hypothetical protein
MYVFIIALTISLFANVATSMQSPQSTLKAYIQQNTLAPTIAIEIFQKEMDSSNYKLPVSFQALMLLDQPRAARWGHFATPSNPAASHRHVVTHMWGVAARMPPSPLSDRFSSLTRQHIQQCNLQFSSTNASFGHTLRE